MFPALTSHYLTFSLGIIFMLCYYLWFHPTGVDLSFLKRQATDRVVPGEAGGLEEAQQLEGQQLEGQELVQLAREPEPGRGGLLPRLEQEVTDSPQGRERVRLLPQMEKVVVRSSSREKVVVRSSSRERVIQGGPGDLSAARRLKYMGQKSQVDEA